MSAAGMAGGAAIAARSAAPQASQVGLKIISATVKTVTRPAQLAIQAVLVSIGWSGCDSGVGRGTVAVGGFTGRLRVIAPLRPEWTVPVTVRRRTRRAERGPECASHEGTQVRRSKLSGSCFDGSAEHVQSDHFKGAIRDMPALLVRTPDIVNVEVPGTEWSKLTEMSVEGDRTNR